LIRLKLKDALSYTGIVSADQKNPYVEVETKEAADKAKKTGYFDVDEDHSGKEKSEGVSQKEENDSTDNEGGQSNDGDGSYTEASLKKLTADEQKEIIIALGGDPEETKNAEERISLILQLQEDQNEPKE
jgi:hypothetical protein